jgi:hypothetical protein
LVRSVVRARPGQLGEGEHPADAVRRDVPGAVSQALLGPAEPGAGDVHFEDPPGFHFHTLLPRLISVRLA